jgi:type II secretory pathway predicted ATPase ExeA
MTDKTIDTPFGKNDAVPFTKSVADADVLSYAQLEELGKVLKRAVDEKSMALVTGEAGVGKTTAVRTFIQQLPTNKFLVVYSGQTHDGLTIWDGLARSLGISPKRFRPHTRMQINQFLSDNLVEQGKEIILVVDEAHLLTNSTLEEIRLLTNADFDRTSPVTVILVGQLSLRTRLKSAGFEAVNQRLKFRYALEGFTEEDTALYIKHRLRIASVKDDLFTPEAIRRIFLASQGIPREINNLCAAAFLAAQNSGATKIDAKLVGQLLDQRDLN